MERFKSFFFLLVTCFAGASVAAVVPTGTNLAAGITPNVKCLYGAATPSDVSDDYQPSGATDGTRASNGIVATFATCHTSDTLWITVGFSTPKTVGSVAVFWAFNGTKDNYMAPQEINVAVYSGGAWETKATEYCFQGDATLYADSLTVVGWNPAVSVDSVKIAMPPLMGYMGPDNQPYNNILWVREFEIYAATGTAPSVSSLVSSVPSGFSVTAKEQKGATRFNVVLPQQADYRLSVYDVSGKNLWSHGASATTAGSQQISWNHGKISGGVYVAVVNQNGHQYKQKFMVRQ